MQIEVWSDVICPWCYIGKRRFEQALAQYEGRDDVEVVWRSYELDPAAPAQYPYSLNEMLAQKYKVSPQQAEDMNTRVSGIAREVGLEYHLADARPGNTLDAHRLMHFAAAQGQGNQATERLMHAYFSESFPVGDRAALARLAPEFGITEADALAMLQGTDQTEAVRADEMQAATYGITGVPFFVIDRKLGVSGAQPVEVFLQALRQASAATPAA